MKSREPYQLPGFSFDTLTYIIIQCAGVAQQVEQWLCNPQVASSNLVTSSIWGYSSVGRASALQAEGRRFESGYFHQRTRYQTRQMQFFVWLFFVRSEDGTCCANLIGPYLRLVVKFLSAFGLFIPEEERSW